jgi:hypothetical protein
VDTYYTAYGKDEELVAYQAHQEVHNIASYHEEDEWKAWSKIGDPVMHMELRKWADVLLVCPSR